jgi:PST family polysaccharide transporter
VVGKTLMPVWFLQGLEKMKYIVFANIIAKAFLLIFILKFINNTSAYLYVNLFYSFGDIVVGILGILFLKKISNIRFRFVSIRSIKQQLLSSWHLFISIIANSTYINSNILILGALTNNRVVGIYAVAEKAMLLLKQTAGIFLQATFPHACKLAEDSVVEFKNFLKKELCLLFIMFSIAGALMYLFAKEICVFFTKKEITQAIEYIKWLSPIPLIVALNIPAYQALIIKNEKKSFTTVITSGALISISLNFLLIPYLSTAGTIISIFVTEIFVTIGLHYALKYKHSHYTL